MKKSFSAMVWILVLVTVISVAYVFSTGGNSSSVISYSEFQQHWVKNEVKEITIESDGMSVKGTLKDGDTPFKVYVRVTRLETFLDENKNDSVLQEYQAPQTIPFWVTILPNLILIIFMVAIFFMIIQQSSGGGRGTMNFGKSKAKLVNPDKQKVTFKDVAGINEEKAELEEIVDFLKIPKRYIEMGARIPKGLLLVGSPGTGKTLLAKAVAGEAGVPFFSMSGSDFVEMFVGVGASRVRDLFEQAKKNSPCIIFIDEIDAVGRQRGSGMGGGHDEREQTLNQLLVEMDGFGVNEGIVVIAATNRVDILDKAILRPGRFDRQVHVNAPDVKGREEILKIHSKNKILGQDIKLDVIAKQTSGFTGADLENLMNEAALLAVRRKKNVITMSEIEESVTRVVAGLEKKSRVISEHDRKLTAYHEAGHAISMRMLEHCDPVHQISIIPRGMAGGFTMHLPREDRSYTSKNKLLDEMVSLLGGRMAEKLILGDISTGAHNDIERATKIARAMVVSYGMSDKLGPINFEKDRNEFTKDYSDEVAALIDEEVKSLIDNAYDRVEKILKDHMEQLHIVAKALLEEETLQGDQFESLFTKGVLPPKKEDDENKVASVESENTITSDNETQGDKAAEGEKSDDIKKVTLEETKKETLEISNEPNERVSDEKTEESASAKQEEEDK